MADLASQVASARRCPTAASDDNQSPSLRFHTHKSPPKTTYGYFSDGPLSPAFRLRNGGVAGPDCPPSSAHAEASADSRHGGEPMAGCFRLMHRVSAANQQWATPCIVRCERNAKGRAASINDATGGARDAGAFARACSLRANVTEPDRQHSGLRLHDRVRPGALLAWPGLPSQSTTCFEPLESPRLPLRSRRQNAVSEVLRFPRCAAEWQARSHRPYRG